MLYNCFIPPGNELEIVSSVVIKSPASNRVPEVAPPKALSGIYGLTPGPKPLYAAIAAWFIMWASC